jgi:citrate lyase beta subunit
MSVTTRSAAAKAADAEYDGTMTHADTEIEGMTTRLDAMRFSFRDLEDSLSIFTGDDGHPVGEWIAEFEDVAQMAGWREIEMVVYSKKLIKGTAQLFMKSEGIVRS